MFKYEMHSHTKISSGCGVFSAEEIVDYFVERKYAGLCITDHFFNGYCAVDKNLSWKDRVIKYCSAYENVKEIGDEKGLDVFFGFEYTCNNGSVRDNNLGADFLIYGLDKQWLLSKDESILSLPVNDFMKKVKQ